MPSAIVATAGAADANSYLTEAEADAYFGDRLHASAWTGATSDTKKAALIWSTRLIDSTVRFTGSKATAAQVLEWPRIGMYDSSGVSFSSSAIPRRLKDVTAELAKLLIASDRTVESAASAAGLSSLRASPVTLAFRDKIEVPKALPDTLRMMLVSSWVWRREPWPLVV